MSANLPDSGTYAAVTIRCAREALEASKGLDYDQPSTEAFARNAAWHVGALQETVRQLLALHDDGGLQGVGRSLKDPTEVPQGPQSSIGAQLALENADQLIEETAVTESDSVTNTLDVIRRMRATMGDLADLLRGQETGR